MRVALIHNQYRIRGGEDVVVDREEALLQSAGVEVSRFEVDNEALFAHPGPKSMHALVTAPSNGRRARQVERHLKQARCDVGHVHNWFPAISPSVYGAHHSAGIPVVQTLHNYRLGCANGTLTRNGKACHECLGGDRSPAIKHRCYRGSGALTRVWRGVVERGWSRGTFQNGVDLYIAPTEYVKDVHVTLGLDEQKILVLPHGVPGPSQEELDASPRDHDGAGALFVGRLSQEKGVDTLLKAWEGLKVPLTLIGDGPLSARVEAAAQASPHIRWLGSKPREAVVESMVSSKFLVSPHIAPETFGLAVAEAMACGLPVIASRLGGPADMITEGVSGRLFDPGDSAQLQKAVLALVDRPDEAAGMGASARDKYLASFTEQHHVEGLLAAFERALQESPSRRAG